MIVKQYIKDFEKLGFGMFVHFGIYSIIGRGEWALNQCKIPVDEYEALTNEFDPDPDWAKKLAATARRAGCKYITLTTRHHDGFSLYDASPLSTYDAPHAKCGRDLVREFVDACRAEGLIPFFYHTLLDWHEPSYNEDFKTYLKYLRDSVEILCTRYGKIGGLWFDGMWNKPNDDWEEDALYGMIRKHQPDAMIINNTGLSARGELGHIELDAVTFERGRPSPINLEDSPKYIGSEMCQIFGDHWGYAKCDFNFKSLAEIINDYCVCRRYGSNFLLNVGPMGSGLLRELDTAMLHTLGEWISTVPEVTRALPTKIEVSGREGDFIMRGEDAYLLFCHKLGRKGSTDVVIEDDDDDNFDVKFSVPETIKSVKWLVTGGDISFVQDGEDVTVTTSRQGYGDSVVIRIAKLEF